MSNDYIPTTDADLIAWVNNFLAYTNANLATLGLVAADLTPVQSAATGFETNFAANNAAQASAQGARQKKDDSRGALVALVRPLARQLQAKGTVEDSHRQSLGLNIKSTSRTAAAAPATRPVATVDTSQRLRHVISFVDEQTPGSRAKPAGVMGCEVWVKVGPTPPVDPSECRYLATDTATPYTAEYEGADAGKIAHYMLRWVNTRGERGPWSQTVSATITG
jgi:hypothetical protein